MKLLNQIKSFTETIFYVAMGLVLVFGMALFSAIIGFILFAIITSGR